MSVAVDPWTPSALAEHSASSLLQVQHVIGGELRDAQSGESFVSIDPMTRAAWAEVACGDADDVFVDPKRHRVYVSCGAGAVDVFEERADSYQRIGHVGTAPGARTSLFVPDIDRLFVAVRAADREPAAIWVFRPTP